MYWKNDWAGFFIVYFKWCYYLCVTPFRLIWMEKEKRFRLDKNWVQMFFCALFYFLVGMWYLKDMRKIPVDDLKRNPVVYFSLAFNLNAVYYHNILLVHIFWRKQQRFLDLVNFDCDHYAGSTLKKRLIAELLCILFAFLALGYTLSGYKIAPSPSIAPTSPTMMLRCLVVEGRYAFFLNQSISADTPCNNWTPPTLEEISTLDIFLALLAFLMETSRQIVGFFSDFFPLICCISLWTCTGSIRRLLDEYENENGQEDPMEEENKIYFNFHRRCSLSQIVDGQSHKNGGIILPHLSHKPTASAPLPPSSSSDEQKEKEAEATPEMLAVAMMMMGDSSNSPAIHAAAGGASGPSSSSSSSSSVLLKGNVLLERYEVCKAFSKRVNKALGQLLFVYVLSSIMYLSTCMDAVLVLEDWYGKLRVSFFFSIFILMFFIGSEIVNKVYRVREWLSDPLNNTFLPEKNLLVLINEVTCKSIGVSGNGMFTVTYSTFMTVMTTTVTFFIIILQFQKSERDDHHQHRDTAIHPSAGPMSFIPSPTTLLRNLSSSVAGYQNISL